MPGLNFLNHNILLHLLLIDDTTESRLGHSCKHASLLLDDVSYKVVQIFSMTWNVQELANNEYSSY